MNDRETFGSSLTRFLDRERAAEHQSHLQSQSQPLAQRVEDGEAIAPARVLEYDPERGFYVLRVDDNLAKFRPGDPVWLSDGERPEDGQALSFLRYDPRDGRVTLQKDRFRDDPGPPPQGVLAIDRRRIVSWQKLYSAIDQAFGKDESSRSKVDDLLGHRLKTSLHPQALVRASEWAEKLELDTSQKRAVAEALSSPDVYLIQGPPGTGKTRVLAHLVEALVMRGFRVLVSAFTHTAIDNALARVAETTSVRAIYKLSTREQSPRLAALGVRIHPSAYRLGLPANGGICVGATAFGALKIAPRTKIDVVILDEAGQMTLPHGVASLLAASRWILVGDHQQLRPVTQGEHADEEVTRSIFEHLHGSYPGTRLTTTYRMNEAINAFPAATFYDGELTPAESVAERRLEFRPGGRFEEILDPEVPALFVDVGHEGNPTRSFEEARLAGELSAELLLHHGLDPAELKIISPFRAQNRAILTACARAFHRRDKRLPRELVADTVERIQGQESEAVILSLTCSDESWLERKVDFFFDPGRLNVAITRARTKLIVLGSRAILRARPREIGEIRKMNLVRKLLRALPTVSAPDLDVSEKGSA